MSTPEQAAADNTGASRGLAVGVLVIALFMDLMDVTIVQVALPTIRGDLGASPSELEWVVSGYMLFFAMLLVTGGRLGDIIGRQRTFLLGVAGFTLASLLACVSMTGWWLVVARLVQGGFAAIMVPQVLSSVQAMYTPKERAPIYGIIGSVTALAAVIGPVLGGWLISIDAFGVGWRSIFLINLPIGAVLFTAAWRTLPDTRSKRPLRLDVRGVLMATAGVSAVMFGLIEGRGHDWAPWVWALMLLGLLMLAVFIGYEQRRHRRDGSALLPPHLFLNRGLASGVVVQATFQGAMNAFTFSLMLYLQAGLFFTAFEAGVSLLPFSLGAFIGVGLAIPLIKRVGKLLTFTGGLLQALGLAWLMSRVAELGNGFTEWDGALPLLIMGTGLTMLAMPLIDVALATVPVADAGAASGAFSTFQQLGAAVGVAIGGVAFFGTLGAQTSPYVLREAFLAGATVGIFGYVVAAGATLLLPDRARVLAALERKDRPEEHEEDTPAVHTVS